MRRVTTLPRLKTAAEVAAPRLWMDPVFAASGNITPANYFGDGKFYAVNTMQPPYQPSGNPPAAADANDLYADPSNATTLPAQSAADHRRPARREARTVGLVRGRLECGARRRPAAAGQGAARDLRAGDSGRQPGFSAASSAVQLLREVRPGTGAAARAAHLKDYDALIADAAAGRLPAVAFYKPQGNLNQHAGYASIADGDAHIADLVAKLRASPQWSGMVIVITYDEFGGAWDQVAPPRGDLLGPGARIPAIVISPLAKHATVDHTPYDTASVLRLIIRRFELESLPGIVRRDRAIAEHGEPPLGDLTNALDLAR